MKYYNPIIPGFYPDPSVCRVDEDYYLVTSSFEYFPGVPIFHSKDLVNWEQIGHCLTRRSQLLLDKARASGGIYAPTLRYSKGIFYMVTTNVSNRGNFYVTTSDPAGEWSDPIWVEQGGIDPSLFFDDDNKVYFTSNAGLDGKEGIVQAEIDIETGKLLTPGRLLWQGTGGRFAEAPHLYKIDGKYYLMIAEGGTEYGHMVTIARSSSPWGPFEACPRNPILTHRNRGGHIIQGTGHADLIQAHDGSWWMVFLAFRNSEQYFHHLGRETFLAPVTWGVDGWPLVNENGTVELEMDAGNLAAYPFEKEQVRDDFDSEALRLCWNFLRNPSQGSWDLCSRKGWLALHGSEITLNEAASPAFIGRRQQHFDCRVSVRLDFNPAAEGEEAGLTIYYNPEHHYDICILRQDGNKQLIVRRSIGDLSAVVATAPIENGPVILEVKANKDEYYLSFGQDHSNITELSKGRTWYLSSEVTRCSFTGVYFGLYATGNGKPSNTPAYFDWFDYEVL